MASKKGTGRTRGKGSASKGRAGASRSGGSSNKAAGNKGPRQTNPLNVVPPAGTGIKDNFSQNTPPKRPTVAPPGPDIVPTLHELAEYQRELDRTRPIRDLIKDIMDQWTKPINPQGPGSGDGTGKPGSQPDPAPIPPGIGPGYTGWWHGPNNDGFIPRKPGQSVESIRDERDRARELRDKERRDLRGKPSRP